MVTSLYDISLTRHGGRGAIAREPIPKGSPVLFCSAPYATVIYWKFRREVCAWCFAYSFESGRAKWNVKSGGLWFCSDECRDSRVKDFELVEGQGIAWWVEINGVFDRLVSHMGKVKKPKIIATKAAPSAALTFLDNVSAADITADFIDRTWVLAEEVSLQESKGVWKNEWTEILTEIELDTARFVLDGLVRKIIEEIYPSSPLFTQTTSNRKGCCVNAGRWIDLMSLQDNELALIQSKPYILASRIRIYRFFRHIAASLESSKPSRSGSATPLSDSSSPLIRVSDILRACFSSSAPARALMARDHGNVFGIWDMTSEEQGSEMLGWGAYVFGSFFNHACSPNLKKRRDKRGLQFYTLRDVLAGEELCISYIDEDAYSAKERIQHLEKDWFFECSCARCSRELEAAV